MDSAEISVRPAVDHDAGRLAEIHIAAWQATYRGIMTDERLDGMSFERAAAGWRRNISNPAKGTEHLVIAQAQGLGSTLFNAAEQRLAALGYSRAFLWVAKGNERAINFYNKHSWIDDGGILEDAQFDPPVIELPHSRIFATL